MRQHLCVGPAISVSDRLPPEPLLTLRASVTHRERKHRVSRLAKQDLIEEAVHDGVATIGEVVDLEAQVSPGRQIIARHEGHDRQYRATLDEPVGMLGDITPRAAARTAAGRQRLSAWLKHLENRSGSQPDPNDPMATYDFTWMWRELGIEKLRK